MDHLECLLNEYLTIQGYIVVCNAKVGKLGHISYCSPEMEPAVSPAGSRVITCSC